MCLEALVVRGKGSGRTERQSVHTLSTVTAVTPDISMCHGQGIFRDEGSGCFGGGGVKAPELFHNCKYFYL